MSPGTVSTANRIRQASFAPNVLRKVIIRGIESNSREMLGDAVIAETQRHGINGDSVLIIEDSML